MWEDQRARVRVLCSTGCGEINAFRYFCNQRQVFVVPYLQKKQKISKSYDCACISHEGFTLIFPQDNWALLHSKAEALKRGVPLHVAVCVPPTHGHMTLRHYSFMLEGLREVEEELIQLGISFHLMSGEPPDCLTPSYNNCSLLHTFI